jgi:antitoxin ParD1/3/4
MQQNAEKLSISLPPEIVRIIREKVDSGFYSSNSEVIREAMRGWMEQEKRLIALDAAIEKGVADAELGKVKDIETVRQELRKQFEC